ncbi:MAG TPA: hypothetical protein VL966_01250 [Alphaproteobacteria bacterium]|jgi:hypothetical protein|nr:hypothetical protein [Alphaproteobacteria bacterium]
MAKKKQPGSDEFVLVNVTYQDGTQSSNRRVPRSELSGFDDDKEIRAVIEAQDRKLAELSGQPRGPIKSIARVRA